MTSSKELIYTDRQTSFNPGSIIPVERSGQPARTSAQNLSFEQLQEQVGLFYLPTFMPADYDLRMTSLPGRVVNLVYSTRPNGPSGLTSGPIISIKQIATDYTSEGFLAREAPKGAYEQVLVGNKPGYFIQGSVVYHVREREGKRVLESQGWNNKYMGAVQFINNGVYVEVASRPASAVDKHTLIRIAESLKPYEG